jgi:8-oxo-dGTP pyrophosphatase MutT (NUDIX family)
VSEPDPAPEPSPSPEPEASWARDGEGDQTIEENWLFRLRRERYRSRATGQAHAFYVIHLADAVSVIALTPDRRMVLVRQFRAGSGRDSLEVPGGLVDPGEDPLAAGVRELIEETGYAGDPPELLGTVWSNPSIMTSRTSFIVVNNARRVSEEPRLDHGEEVVVELVPARAIPAMIRDGRIDHALVVCGLLWWLQSQFPGRLAKPGPAAHPTLGIVMMVIAGAAIFFGLLTSRDTPSLLEMLTKTAALATVAFLIFAWRRSWKIFSDR